MKCRLLLAPEVVVWWLSYKVYDLLLQLRAGPAAGVANAAMAHGQGGTLPSMSQ